MVKAGAGGIHQDHKRFDTLPDGGCWIGFKTIGKPSGGTIGHLSRRGIGVENRGAHRSSRTTTEYWSLAEHRRRFDTLPDGGCWIAFFRFKARWRKTRRTDADEVNH